MMFYDVKIDENFQVDRDRSNKMKINPFSLWSNKTWTENWQSQWVKVALILLARYWKWRQMFRWTISPVFLRLPSHSSHFFNLQFRWKSRRSSFAKKTFFVFQFSSASHFLILFISFETAFSLCKQNEMSHYETRWCKHTAMKVP